MELRHHPRQFGADAHAWVDHHMLMAPVALMGAYVVLAVLLIPVWWLQVVAGFAFGAVLGTVYCTVSAIVNVRAVSVSLSRWLAADAVHSIESHRARLAALDEKLGHNGLLVVIVLRLVPIIIPFSVANYLLGVTRVSLTDVAIGTALASPPHISMTTVLGAHPYLAENWRFWACIGLAFFLLSLPVVIRYRKPEWFRQFGIE